MPDLVQSARADASGTAVITVNPVLSGIIWIVSQVSVEAITSQVAVTSIFRKNGRYITSSNQGSSSTAGGSPSISCKSGDVLTMTWQGLVLNDTAILTMLYSELTWQQYNQLGAGALAQIV